MTEENPLASCIVRKALPSDWNRIRKDWRESYRNSVFGRFLYTCGDLKLYDEVLDGVMTRLLVHGEVNVLCWPEDQRAIVGWCVYEEPNIVHYVYVSKDYRRLGAATRLVPYKEDVVYTHSSLRLRDLKLPESWRFDPRPALREAT